MATEQDAYSSSFNIRSVKIYDDYVMVMLEQEKIQLSLDDYVAFKIKDLKSIDLDTHEKLLERQKCIKAYRSCLRKLAVKDHSTKTIRDHLKKYDLAADDVSQIIDKLTGYGLLDDEQYCQNRISALSAQLYSYRQIKAKLLKEGLSQQLIDEHLVYESDDQQSKAEALAQRHARRISGRSEAAKKQNILQKLVGSGFSYEEARSAVESLSISVDNEQELLKKEYEKLLKRHGRNAEENKTKDKIIASLLKKGFRYEDIKKIVEDGYE